MKSALLYPLTAILSLSFAALFACRGTEVGLNAVRPVNPTGEFSTLDPSLYSEDEFGGVVKDLIRSYQQYQSLFSAAEKESPTVENTCYELPKKVERVKPLLKEQENVLTQMGASHQKLATFREDNAIITAVEAGNLFVAKARERVKKYDELMDITNSFSDDCPTGTDWVLHLTFGVTGLAQYASARAKAPHFNETARQLEELSAQEKISASNLVRALKALR